MKNKYDKEFKLQAIRMVHEQKRPVAQVARELGLSENTLYRWVSEFKQDGANAFPGSGQLKPDDKAMLNLQKRIRDLEEENEILKKGDALLRQRPALIYPFIHEHRCQFRVEKLCALFQVARSGYYAWLQRKPSTRETRREQLKKEIRRIFDESRQLYGSPKITKILQKTTAVSERTVTRLMKEMGLRSRTVKKYKATTNSNHSLPVAENVLNQQFQVTKPNQVWCADITYVATEEGWLYVASVLDLCTRKIVGWSMGERMTKELVLRALDQAYNRQRPKTALIHHSDRGSQYASYEYQGRLRGYNMTSSMSRKGNCYDNACIESFHSVLKKELVYLHRFKTRDAAKSAIFEYIECFYNRKRVHSSIGYITPDAHERSFCTAA
ncbi:IS3 family transposase [Paenibacillus elgii]|uniref:IS3 family transposase n=1 Tax=Paenibacillus elgii TaxID=189691 RepID=UPI00203DB358|nr:IS3 family transposase [Paenibacillus elgii]MCM3269532.1 IS3 family transposase [Paenibacillus elgii]